MLRLRPPGTAALLILVAGLSFGCGGGGGPINGGPIEAPVVKGFSPWVAGIAPDTGDQVPRYTDSALRVSTDVRFSGAVVVFLQGETDVDPNSVLLTGSRSGGVNPSALTFQREVPGVGNVAVPVQLSFEDAAGTGTRNAVVCRPLPPFAREAGDLDGDGLLDYAADLPAGQYTIGVYSGLRSSTGKSLRDGPIFHTFTVGGSDSIAPRVITSSPVNAQQQVGAGTPPPPAPPGIPETNIANVVTNIFGDPSPDVVIRFSESIRASSITAGTIQVVDAGAGGAPPPQLLPAPGFPQLRSLQEGETLPSNGHEVIWRIDPLTGGFPFGTQVRVTVRGAWVDEASRAASPTVPDAPAPIRDLEGNAMELDYAFTFGTIAPQDLPENPFPEYAIWWSASDRVGAIDTINQRGLGDQVLGVPFPFGVPENVLPQFTDTVATAANIPDFDPLEIGFDGRTNPATCHSWIYVQSQESGQVAVLHSRDGIPVALIDSPSPGGIAVQTGPGGANALLVTNSGANTFTAYDIGLQTPGLRFLNGPLFIQKVQPTGNTPRAIAITSPPPPDSTAGWNRDGPFVGPTVPIIMYADYADGTVNTIRMADAEPVRQFSLGPTSAPNDVCWSPCFTSGTSVLYAAISQGGGGKVAYYVSGPGCQTGSQTTTRPDAITGELSGLDGPDGLDENLHSGTDVMFSVAESGSNANAISTLGVQAGAPNLPRLVNRFTNVGSNPTKIAHRSSWSLPAIGVGSSPPTCVFGGTVQGVVPTGRDVSMVPTKDLYICARGSSQVTVIDLSSGARRFYSPILIPGVRFVAGPPTQ